MGKVKPVSAASSTDENNGEWLSTRNKKKISPPPLKMRGGNHFVRRPVPRSPLVTLMDEMPVALTTTKKQTSIADFFSPHLKGLPRRDDAEQTLIPHVPAVKQEPTSARCSEDDMYAEDEMYADFDMPGPTPAHSGFHVSQNPVYGDFDVPVPGPSRGSAMASPVDDHFARGCSLAGSPVARWTTQICTKLCDQADRSLEGRERKTTHCNVTLASEDRFGEQLDQTKGKGKGTETCCSRSDSQQGRVTGWAGQNVDSVSRTKSGSGVALLYEDRRRKQRSQSPERQRGGEHALDTSLGKRKEKNNVHRGSSQPDGNSSEEDAFCDSLQTPLFLKEAHHTLDFSQLPAVVGATSGGAGSVKNRPKPTDQGVLTESCEIREKDGVFAGFTEASSLHFTDDDDSSQDTQQWWSSQPTSHTAADRKTAKPKPSVSSAGSGSANRRTAKPKPSVSSAGAGSADRTTAKPKLSMSSAGSSSMDLDEHIAEASSGCGGETFDSLQTPEFLSSEGGLGGSQEMGRWREGSQEVTVTTGRPDVGNGPLLCEDLHTPGFLKGLEDCSSLDSC